MMRYKLILEYDGTSTVGWQAQDTGTSIQGAIADAVFKFSGDNADVVACGRTDAGVHALAMPCHVDICRDVDAGTVMRALNFYLKKTPVAVLSATAVADDFHARFDCVGRAYRYVILNRPARSPLYVNRAWWIPRKLDVEKMRAAAAQMLGNHDWTSFRSSECQAKSPIKTVDSINITAHQVSDSETRITIDVAARSFLHHMVRNIVGTLVEIGLGKDMDVAKIFAAKSRSAAGPTAPAAGLYFVDGTY